MIRFALVGDIGSGKTHISKLFEIFDFNTDAEVSKLYKKVENRYNRLKSLT